MPSLVVNSIFTKLNTASSLNLYTHKNPDGDAIGSIVAIALAFGEGKDVNFIIDGQISTDLEPFMCRLQLTSTAKLGLNVICDCVRAGLLSGDINKTSLATETVLFDHHPHSDLVKKVKNHLHQIGVSSTCELVYQFFKDAKIQITPKIATSLLLGIYTDTGGFKHQNTTCDTLRVSADLISKGADLKKISSIFTNNRSLTKNRLWGLALQKISVNRWGLVVVKISRREMECCGANDEDLNGLANFLKLVDGTRGAIVLVENDHSIRAIVRFNDRSIDAGRLAAFFGGRGTRAAAGFSVEVG